MPFFVYLEFTDPKVREFLYSLRSAITGGSDSRPIHVTVRGPYDTLPDLSDMEELSEEIKGYGVVIGGAGTFRTPSGFVVYLRVQSQRFEKIWWKPDYSVDEFGINPHITMCETRSKAAAEAIEKFLRAERIEIFTFGTVLTVNMSKQGNLFETNTIPSIQEKRAQLFERWSVKPGIIQRATDLREFLAGKS